MSKQVPGTFSPNMLNLKRSTTERKYRGFSRFPHRVGLQTPGRNALDRVGYGRAGRVGRFGRADFGEIGVDGGLTHRSSSARLRRGFLFSKSISERELGATFEAVPSQGSLGRSVGINHPTLSHNLSSLISAYPFFLLVKLGPGKSMGVSRRSSSETREGSVCWSRHEPWEGTPSEQECREDGPRNHWSRPCRKTTNRRAGRS